MLDQGQKNYTKDKVMDNDFYILTVAAIAKELYLRNVRCEKIHQTILDKFQENVPNSIINTFLMNRMADIDPEYEYWMEATAKEYVRELTAKIFDFGYNEKTMKMSVLGGGAKLLEHFSTFDRSRITFNFDINEKQRVMSISVM